jgi:hypothetical protein
MTQKDFVPSAEQVGMHVARCKICSFPVEVKEQLNDALLRHQPITRVVELANELDFPCSEQNVTTHKKYLPFIVSSEQVRTIVAKARTNTFSDASAVRITEMEERVARLTLDVETAQNEIKHGIWHDTAPALIRRIQKEAEEGVVPIRDLAYALDLLMKNGLLLTGGVTNRTEVTKKDEQHVIAELRSDPESADLLKELYRRRTGMAGTS